MATKAAQKRSEASKKAAATRKKNEAKREKGDAPPKPFDDLHTQEDSQAVPGHFVEVTAGEHKGRYGVLVDTDQYSDNVVVRTRDSSNERLLVAYKDLKPAEAGRR